MDYQELELHHRRLVENPTDPTSFAVLRDFFAQSGQNSQLAELYEFRAGNLADPRERAEHLLQAALVWLDRENNRPRGQRDLEEAFRVHPTHEAIGDKLEEVYRADQNLGALAQLITQRILSVEQLGEIPETARLRGRLYQNLGEIKERVDNDPKEAIRCYKRAYAIDPSNVLALYLAREIYRRAGDMRSASKLYELEIKSEPTAQRQVALLRELATMRADQLQDLDGAVEALERATQIAPTDADALYDLSAMFARRAQGPSPRADDAKRAADCLVQLARASEAGQALDYLEYALDLSPGHEVALSTYVEFAMQSGAADRMEQRVRGWYAAAGGPAQASSALLRAMGQIEWDLRHDAAAARPLFQVLAERGDATGAQRLAEVGGGAMVAGAARAAPRAVPKLDALPDFVTAPKVTEPGGDVDALFGGDAPMPAGVPEAPTRLMPPDIADELAGAAGGAPEPEPEPGGVVDVERLRDQAQKLRMMGKDAQVEQIMEQIVAQLPGDPEAVAYLERRYRAKGNFAGLHKMLIEAGMSRTLAPNARIMRLKEAAALAEGRLNNLDGAVMAWQRVLAIDPQHGESRRSLERLLRKLQKWGELVELMEQMVQLAEDEAEKLTLLTRIAGLQESSLKDPAATLDTVWRIHALEDRNVKHLRKIEQLAEATERWDDLARALQAEVDVVENPAEKLRARERLLLVQQEKLAAFHEALETVDSILVDHPDHVATLRRQIDLLAATSQPDRAADALEVLIGRLPDREKPEALGRLAELSRTELQDLTRAADALQRALQIDPVNESVREELHRMYDELGRHHEIAESYETWAKAVKDPAKRKQLLRRAAQVLDQQVGDLEQACERYEMILKDGDDQESLEAFARLHEMRQDWPALVDNVVRRAELAPEPEDKARLFTEAAQLLDERIGEPAKAALHLERILKELKPDHRETLGRLVDTYVKAEDYASAARTLDRLREVTPDTEEQLKHSETLAQWYREQLQDAVKAIATYEGILAQWTSHVGAMVALSELYDEVKDFEKLLKVLRARSKAADLPHEQAALLLEGAKAAEEKLEDGERAWGWYQEALARDPDSGDLFDSVCEAARRLKRWDALAGLYEGAATRSKSDDERVDRLRQAAKVWEEDAERPAQALEDIVEAVRTMPGDDRLVEEADRLARVNGSWELLGKAYDHLLRRADLADDRVALLRRFADVVLQDGRRPEFALGPLLRAMEEHPDDPSLFEMYEQAARASGHYEDLLRAYDKRCRAAQEPAERWPLMMHAAEIYGISMRNAQKGLQVLALAINQDVFSDEMAEAALKSVRDIEDTLTDEEKGTGWKFLVAHYQRLAQGYDVTDPTRIVFHRRIATAQLDGAGDPAAAFEALRTAHLLAPTDEMLIEDLEKLAREHEFLEALANHYGDALQRSTRVDVAKDLHRRRAAVLENDLGRIDEAADHYWQLLQLDPDDADARQKIAGFYERVGRWNDLVVILEEDLGKVLYDDEKVDLLLRIGRIWEEKIQNRYEAIDVYRKVLKLRPDDEELAAKIKSLSAPRLAAEDEGDDLLEGYKPPSEEELWGSVGKEPEPGAAPEPGPESGEAPATPEGEPAGGDAWGGEPSERPTPVPGAEVAPLEERERLDGFGEAAPATGEGLEPGAQGAASPGYDILPEEPAPAFGEPGAPGIAEDEGAAVRSLDELAARAAEAADLPATDEPPAAGETPGLAWDEHDDSAKVDLQRLEFLQQPSAPEAGGPPAPEMPAAESGDLAPFDIGVPEVAEAPSEAVEVPVEAADVPIEEDAGELVTGEIQVEELEEALPESPRRSSVPPPPPRPPRRKR
ncbi:MAG: tetratricopeptide repeat protein [Deltaproteobacteria bacterium]|nr:tetratricopeptide repeat protein [Deltaproteobacteria bacterium]